MTAKPKDEDLPVYESERAYRQERHRNWKELNMATLNDAGLCPYPFTITNRGESVLFREPGRPKVDFYPSTGRWRVAGVSQTFRGGAKKFLNWYQYYCDPNKRTGQPRPLRSTTNHQRKETNRA